MFFFTHLDSDFEFVIQFIVFGILDGDKDVFGSLVVEGNVYRLVVQVQVVIVVSDAAGLWALAEIYMGIFVYHSLQQ